MFGRSKKKKTVAAISCTFCGETFEDVSAHVATCPAVNRSSTASTAKPISRDTSSAPSVVKPTPTPTPTPVSPPTSPTPVPVPVMLPVATPPPEPAPEPTPEPSPEPEPQEEPTVPSEDEESADDDSAPSSDPPTASPPASPPRVEQAASPSKEPALIKAATTASLPTGPPAQLRANSGWKATRAPSSARDGPMFSSLRVPRTERSNFLSRSTSSSNMKEDMEDEENADGDEEEDDASLCVGTVLFDYQAASDVEISVQMGARVYILDRSDPDWVYIDVEGKEGFVPVGYVQEDEEGNDTAEDDAASATETEEKSPGSVHSSSSSSSNDRPRDVAAPAPSAGLSQSRPPPKKEKSYIGALGSTLRVRKKKKPAMEFTISRSDDSTPTTPLKGSSSEISISGPDSPSVEAAPAEPRDNSDQRTKIAREILSTEQHYLNVIQSMIQRYRETLLYRLELFGGNVTRQQIMDIFINLEMIIPINQQLLNDLQKLLETWSPESTVGDIFVRVAPFFRMYNQYSTRYDHALATLNKCMKNEEFLALVEEIDTTTKLGSRLESLLIAPIQRIPRYTLLLQELRKSTPAEHADIAHLEKAIPLMQDVANYINSNMSAVENQEKLMSLSLAGAQSLLKPHRVLLHEGVLVGSDKKKQHLWLFNDILVLLPEGEAKNKENLNKPKYQWPLHLVWLGDSSTKSKTQASFAITGPTRAYTLVALIDEVAGWTEKIHHAIVQHLENLTVTQDTLLAQEKEAKMTIANPNRFGTFEFPNTAVYTGWWNLGEFHGSGIFRFFDSVYEGTFVNSLKSGTGFLRYVTGDIYEGEWKDDKPNGKGIFTYKNGDVYNGPWLDGMKHGKGELRAVRGDSYCGEWARDQPHGLGEMSYASGLLYNGNWENGQRHHYGIMINPTGERYEGEWVNGVRNGKGRMEYFEGCVYDGYWKDGYYHGKGVYVSPNGRYDGEWVADQREGQGVMTYTNGKVYKGGWKRDLYHGQGTLTYHSGLIECYNGEWVQQKRHGSGMLRFFNGDMYDGHFKDNRFHGTGVYTFGNGNSIKCKWSRGNVSGECVFTRPPRKGEKKNDFTYVGVFKDGMLSASDRPPIYLPNIPFGEIDLL